MMEGCLVLGGFVGNIEGEHEGIPDGAKVVDGMTVGEAVGNDGCDEGDSEGTDGCGDGDTDGTDGIAEGRRVLDGFIVGELDGCIVGDIEIGMSNMDAGGTSAGAEDVGSIEG
jgi:hypothetical protein